MPDNTTPAGAVFLSYASQDAEAAKRICEALRSTGIEVWFDQNELVGGDAWDQKIRGQIGSCALFMPVISANTQARLEGYFRLEWKLAAQRTHTMADEKAFLLPVVIDATRDADARVPAEFKAIQWTRLPGGETPPAFVARVRKLLLGEMEAGRPRPADHGARPPARTFSKWWWIAPIFGMTMALALVFKERRPELVSPAVATPVTGSVAPAVSAESSVPRAGARPEQIDSDPARASKSVAVLAFANLSDDKNNEYFSDGISEELLNVLAKIPGLKVSARTSAFYFKGKEVPVPEIARQLGVAYVVEGSVRKQGDKVRITAQLIKAADGFHVWSDTFTRDLKDIFAVQDEIAGLIAGNLSLKLGMTSPGAIRQVDAEAYRLMLLGRDLIYRATPDDLNQAEQYLQDAIKHDEKFAPAWAWLSIARWALTANGSRPIVSGFNSAREAAEKALALQPDLPEANTATGFIYYGYDWDWVRARATFERASALAPGGAATISNLTRLAITRGENDDAVRLGRQAVAVDPLNGYAQYVLSMALLQADRYDELERQAREFKNLTRIPAKQLVFALVLQGKNAEALQLAEEFKSDNNRTFLLALTHWACGHRPEADEGLERLKTAYADTAAYQIAELYAYRGSVDEAFTWLETSYRQRDTGMIYLKNDPFLKKLHADPRWPVLLRKMHLADDQLK